jgi:hypothetical protein
MSAEEKAVEETAKTVRHYLDCILAAPLSEFGLLLKDQISYWRFKNQVNTALKAKAFLEAKGINPKEISGKASPEIVVPLLEASGEASDDTISTMFANLLADAIDPTTASLIHPSYGKVLNQLSPLDAQILSSLYREIESHTKNIQAGKSPEGLDANLPAHRQLGYNEEPLAAAMKIDLEVIRLSFENIRRLGICDEGHDFLSRANKVGRICLTDYGLSFMKKCVQRTAITHVG